VDVSTRLSEGDLRELSPEVFDKAERFDTYVTERDRPVFERVARRSCAGRPLLADVGARVECCEERVAVEPAEHKVDADVDERLRDGEAARERGNGADGRDEARVEREEDELVDHAIRAEMGSRISEWDGVGGVGRTRCIRCGS
jgi:hypothetical protein